MPVNPHMMNTLNISLPLCSSKPHNYDNYDKTPYVISSYLQLSQANFFATLFTFLLGWINTSSSTPQQTYFYLESDPQLGKSKT